MNPREEYVKALNEFRKLIETWQYGKPTQSTRIEINKRIQKVRKIVLATGVSKSMTIAPPPIVGGLIMKNISPFDCIFELPYGMDTNSVLIDMLDEAIGVIEASDNFTLEKETIENNTSKISLKSNKVFIVHGRDNELKESTARFLEKLNLKPIILHEQTNKGKTIIEKFENYSDVGFVIVLLTPDDIGSLREEKNIDRFKKRARQNVIFELGYFIGKLGRHNVVALVKGDIEIPSDYDGIVYIGIDNSGGWKMMLAREIKANGIDIDLNQILE